MVNKWEIDKAYLRKCIDDGYHMLNNPYLSKIDKLYVKDDIKLFERFLKGCFELQNSNSKTDISLKRLKELVLQKMKKEYEILGDNLINFIISLGNIGLFDCGFSINQTDLSMDTQAELTLLNYREHSQFLYSYVNRLLSSRKIAQIQMVENLNGSSYCHYSEIRKIPFLIIDPLEAPWIFNHEIEHGIEIALNWDLNSLFLELTPIYFELLFTDILYHEQGFVLHGDYQNRVENASFYFICLDEYFGVMQKFAETNFDVSLETFKSVFFDNVSLCDNTSETLQRYLIKEILSGEIEKYMRYLFSYLKAIELYDQTIESQKDGYDILKPYLTPKFNFEVSDASVSTYENYLNKMLKRVR